MIEDVILEIYSLFSQSCIIKTVHCNFQFHGYESYSQNTGKIPTALLIADEPSFIVSKY